MTLTAGPQNIRSSRSARATHLLEGSSAGQSRTHTLPPNAQTARGRRCDSLFRRHDRHDEGHSAFPTMNFNALAPADHCGLRLCPHQRSAQMLSVMPVFHGFGLGIGIHTALDWRRLLHPRSEVQRPQHTPICCIKKQPNIIPGVPTLFEALLRADQAGKCTTRQLPQGRVLRRRQFVH